MTDKYLTTPQVCAVLGITRQTLYNWNATPDGQAPGRKGVLLWKRGTVEALAVEHGRETDWEALTWW